MFEGMLNIDVGENELGKKLLACANAREPFEAFGRQYMVEGISRNFDGVNGWIRAEMREMPQLEWRGPDDGLPPVGLEVEHSVIGCGWSRCVVLAYGEKKTFYRDHDGHEWARACEEVKFRPVLTQRDRGIENLISTAYPKDFAGFPDRNLITRMYDAGVRAPEVK